MTFISGERGLFDGEISRTDHSKIDNETEDDKPTTMSKVLVSIDAPTPFPRFILYTVIRFFPWLRRLDAVSKNTEGGTYSHSETLVVITACFKNVEDID